MIQKADSGGLPSGYTQVNYLQSSGTQYIDTGRKLTQDSDITIDFCPLVLAAPETSCAIFGSRQAAYVHDYTIFRDRRSFVIDFGDAPQNRYIYYFKDQQKCFIRINKSGIFLDGTLIKAFPNVDTFETPTNAMLFDVGGHNWTEKKATDVRIYGYKNSNHQNFVPCLDGNGVPCFYDTVGQQTYYNQGTGSFTWG